jgi:hypothetical protein
MTLRVGLRFTLSLPPFHVLNLVLIIVGIG